MVYRSGLNGMMRINCTKPLSKKSYINKKIAETETLRWCDSAQYTSFPLKLISKVQFILTYRAGFYLQFR